MQGQNSNAIGNPQIGPVSEPRITEAKPKQEGDSEFSNFENLTRKLVGVSKAELDKKRDES